MIQDTISYQDDEQTLIGQVFFDEKNLSKQPGIIVFPAFEGLSPFAIEYAKKLAKKGFITFAADMYGDAKTADTIEGCLALIDPFLKDRSLVRRRARLAFDTFSSLNIVDKERIGAIGFCFGGMCALEIARSGAQLTSLVSAHGVLPKSDLPNEKIHSRILILHGYKDPMVPHNLLTPFAEEMEMEKVNDWRFVFFGNGKHSFTDPRTGTFDPDKEAKMGREYNKMIADATYHYALDFFKETLK